MRKNILITGISGFVGTNLVDYFKQFENHTLYGLDIVNVDIEGVEKVFSWENLNDVGSMDIVIHLAGKAHDLKNTTEEQIYFDINYGLTKEIFDWYLSSTCSQFYLMSSVKAVADVVHGEMLCEDDIPNPITAYGRSKLKAEEYILNKNVPKGKSFYIFRPCMIHGPGNKGNLNLLYSIVSKGIPWPLGAYSNERSFVSIQNLCFVFNCFIGELPESGIYNIADDESLSTNEIIKLIYDSKDKVERIWNLPKGFINSMAKVGDVCRLPFNKERLQKLTENYRVSNKKLLSVLKKDLPKSSVEGMKLTLESFKCN
ncbi:NAD-dependent epimerase/dehydratase family protein [Marinifilum fragile]|uniref:NAD-dependent epimerase/dehydratase family protein n=1 Tax=Marinifilum fragile TaxID=570161 RepID=UPI002AABC7CC|nr:NAD-dependent epimerase/dehydratase family protein [Marinifilum fragile]